MTKQFFKIYLKFSKVYLKLQKTWFRIYGPVKHQHISLLKKMCDALQFANKLFGHTVNENRYFIVHAISNNNS